MNLRVTRRRRLQREPDFTGQRLERFSQVWLRHGLPGAALGALCLLVPELRALLVSALSPMLANPAAYAAGALVVLVAIVAYTLTLDRRIDLERGGWILYLLGISIWEEWVFRLAFPWFGVELGLDTRQAVVLSNVLFGLAHYFTLRWKWYWCVGAALGGMGLSRLLDHHFDLALLVAAHWLGTFLNTPRQPAGRAEG